MNPTQAVKHVLFNYFVFSGRAQRSEFWWWSLFMFILNLVVEVVETSTLGVPFGQFGPISVLVTLAFFVPGVAVHVRRLHDIGRSGWWLLLWFVPVIGWIVLIVFACFDSQPGANTYGRNPKGVESDFPVTANA